MWLMLFTHYFFGYVGTALCSIGLILALCSVYIFTRRQMRSAVATYLVGLSISDSCLLSLGLVIAINSSIPPNQQSESYYSSHLHKYLFPYVYPCVIWFQFTSVWITIGFAIDRWFAIKWPMLHYTYSSKRACYIVLAIYGLGLIYSLPRFFEYKTESQREKLTVIENITEYVEHLVITNRVLENRLYQYIVHLILYSLFQSILPLLMLSYFNVELIRSINASSNFLKRFTSLYVQTTRLGREPNTSRYREGTKTRSVICLIGLFTLCQVPASILHYIYMFYRNHPVLYICYDISNLLILFNSAVNFFIFTYCNRKFRRELGRVCYHAKPSRNLMLRSSSHQSFRRTNSYMRTPAHSSYNLQQQQLDITQGNSWEFQRRHSRIPVQSDNETCTESMSHIRKKYSDASIQSQYHLHPFYHRSESLISIRSSNMHHNNSNQTQRQGRFSPCDFNYQQQKTFPYINDEQDLQIIAKQPRSYRERLLFSRKKHSVTMPTNAFNQQAQPSHHKINKRGKKKMKLLFTYNPITSSSSATTTSNVTRSTVNTTGSDSSILIDPNKLFKPIVTNNKRKSRRFFRK